MYTEKINRVKVLVERKETLFALQIFFHTSVNKATCHTWKTYPMKIQITGTKMSQYFKTR